MNNASSIELEFRRRYAAPPVLVRSPGRVNLIGEHTDYNMGFVLPAAIDRAIYFAVTPRADHTCNVYAMDAREDIAFTLREIRRSDRGWPNYLMGVVDQLLRSGRRFSGFDCVFGGDVPIGAGVSSSAALEAGLAYALNRVFALGIDNLELVQLAQKAENEFVGVRCGIMDQYASVFGMKDHVLRIDCRSLEHVYSPFDSRVASIVLFHSGVSHSLAGSEYNRRREECAAGVAAIRKLHPQVASLRDASPALVEDAAHTMPPAVYRRCKYVVEENARVLRAARLLQQGDMHSFGELLNETHDGLRDLYEVSCRELDFLVDAVRDHPAVYGARLMGGGFGGCTINIVRGDAVEAVCNSTAEKYRREFNIDLQHYVMSIGPGTSLLND
ncbi:MAG TPA: galactokinase [Bacteroidota bacterium]|nr:galactokinase [Bacteroidota bacterium]